MRLIRRYDQRLPGGCVLAIGSFEALHIGHQAIIQRSMTLAKQEGVPAAVMMFEPLPNEFFAPAQRRIYRLSKRLAILRELGIDIAICLRFCQELADMPADRFIRDILVEQFAVRAVVIGEDFRFGKERAGDRELLQAYAQDHSFAVEVADLVRVESQRVSSTWIKELLNNGDFDQAQSCLGRRFTVEGKVLKGDGRGAGIGFPTANIAHGSKIPPLQGVYATELHMDGECYPAVMNAGVRPTVDGERYQLEAHIFDFDQQIYGRSVSLNPLCKLRDEKAFASIDELKEAIGEDVNRARKVFKL